MSNHRYSEELSESTRTNSGERLVRNNTVSAHEPERGAYDRRGAAAYLSISVTTLWRLTASGKIRKTGVGVYPKFELDRWLKKECP